MAFLDFRSRLFLITPRTLPEDFSQRFASAVAGGDIGCMLFDGDQSDERAFQDNAAPYVQTAQGANIAVLVADDNRLADRLDADGVHLTDPKAMDTDTQTKLADRGMIVGIGGINTRHLALSTGEREPDYLFFGRTDREATEETHPKTVTLSTWWAQMMKIPCVALAGTSDEAFTALAEAGVEFLAVREQIWNAEDPGAEVKRLNTMLDAIAHKRAEAAA
ncbi:MAG: thiamine phosphate synthase [Hyphomicrobiales bacterium]